MAKIPYRQSPDHEITGWPPGIKYIVGNEGCERFSYYGMNAILYIYCVTLYVSSSMTEDASADMATSTVHLFKTGVYAFPMIGAIIFADRFLGKYNTILWISWIYCLGHLVLSLTEGSIVGLTCGLGLIAIGSGGIKPCVSANVGDQFGRSNWSYLERVYQIFYFMINFGSFFCRVVDSVTTSVVRLASSLCSSWRIDVYRHDSFLAGSTGICPRSSKTCGQARLLGFSQFHNAISYFRLTLFHCW